MKKLLTLSLTLLCVTLYAATNSFTGLSDGTAWNSFADQLQKDTGPKHAAHVKGLFAPGGTVTQATSKSTGVTLSTMSGQITMNAAALASAAKVSFVVTNTLVTATDVPVVSVASGGTANAYRASVTAVGSGVFTITVENITGGSLSEAPIVNFVLTKGS